MGISLAQLGDREVGILMEQQDHIPSAIFNDESDTFYGTTVVTVACYKAS